jgi:cytochrome d ubiquinol oxidase subunit II
MLDYESLKLVWWVLVGVLLIGFALFDGIDMGAAILLPFAAREDNERRAIINTVGPHWDGNQVWLITAGGAIFAAWPLVYATAFSGLYWALLLVLFALFLRPTGFDYRSKIDDTRWRNAWDWGLFVGGAVPALIFGVAFGNLLQGLPFHLDNDLRAYYTGSFFELLNPFALLAGVISLSMIAAHGGARLVLRTDAAVVERSRKLTGIFAMVHVIAFAAAGLWVLYGIQGYTLVSATDPNLAINPLNKVVEMTNAGWQGNFKQWPALWLAPAIGLMGAILLALFNRFHRPVLALIASCLAITGTIATAGVALFPFVMPSATSPVSSLTVWDATSSQLTLGIMAVVAAVFVPLILAYTVWGYAKMWHRIDNAHIEKNRHSAY